MVVEFSHFDTISDTWL